MEEVIRDQVPLDWDHQHETQRGRKLSWTATVYNLRQHPKAQKWKGLSRLIHIHRVREDKDGLSHSDSFYISDLAMSDAARFNQGIRAHWGIENRLHWVKDVLFKEDKNRIRKGSGPILASILSATAINILRSYQYDSITEGIEYARANISKIICDIRT